MKKIVMLFFLFGIVFNIMAQKKINLSELNVDQLNLRMDQAAKMKNTGAILTLGGGAVFMTSSLLLPAWLRNHSHDWSDPAPNIYAVLILGGCASTIAGIPVWIIGGVRKSKAEIALKRFDVKTIDLKTSNSMAIGIGLTLRF